MPPFDAKEYKERDERIRKREDEPVSQPSPSSRRGGGGGGMLMGVIRSKPADDAPYVTVQQVRCVDDATGEMEFVEGAVRPVLCEPKTLAGHYPDQWVYEGDAVDDPAIVVHWLVMSGGRLYIMHKGRQQYVSGNDLDSFEPTDCYLFGS